MLLSGRLLLACLLSARTDGDVRQEEEAGLAVHAAAVLLRHMAVILPITLGAAEVLDETCRGEFRLTSVFARLDKLQFAASPSSTSPKSISPMGGVTNTLGTGRSGSERITLNSYQGRTGYIASPRLH